MKSIFLLFLLTTTFGLFQNVSTYVGLFNPRYEDVIQQQAVISTLRRVDEIYLASIWIRGGVVVFEHAGDQERIHMLQTAVKGSNASIFLVLGTDGSMYHDAYQNIPKFSKSLCNMVAATDTNGVVVDWEDDVNTSMMVELFSPTQDMFAQALAAFPNAATYADDAVALRDTFKAGIHIMSYDSDADVRYFEEIADSFITVGFHPHQLRLGLLVEVAITRATIHAARHTVCRRELAGVFTWRAENDQVIQALQYVSASGTNVALEAPCSL